MNVLHILHPWHGEGPSTELSPGGSDAGVLLCREAIAALPEARHEVLVIGGSEEGRRVRALGLEIGARLAPPLRSLRLAKRGVRRWIQARGEFEAIVAWDVNSRRLLGAEAADTVREIDLSSACGGGGVAIPRFPMGDRAAMRTSLGIGEGEFAVGLLADPPTRGDATRFVFVICMLHVIGVPIVGVMSAASHDVRRAMSASRLSNAIRMPIVTGVPMATAVAACDAGVMALGTRFGGQALGAIESERVLAALAMQAGVPVVTWDTSVVPEALRGECMTRSGHPGHISKVVLRLAEDRSLRSRLREECLRLATGDGVDFGEYVRKTIVAASRGRTEP